MRQEILIYCSPIQSAKFLNPQVICRNCACRSALAPGASPTLTANGAALAAVFLQKGLAVGDVAVLNRLMGLLISPIAEWANRKQDVYAEWVAVRAKVALLEVHAHFAVFAATSSNEASRHAVAHAHAPHLK